MNALKNEHSKQDRCDHKLLQENLQLQLDLDFCQKTVNTLSQSDDRLRRFSSHLMFACDEERQRLANEIHDQLGQNLLALRIDVSMLHARTLEAHPHINHRAAAVLNHIDVALANVREIINSLYPPVLALGILASVEWKVGEFEKRHRIPCALQVDGHDNDFAPYDNRSLSIIRILHESLTNVARHAEATHVYVTLSGAQSRLTMQVTDDGIGIQPKMLDKDGAYGLTWVQERIGTMGGEFAIDTNPRQRGTMMTVSVPR